MRKYWVEILIVFTAAVLAACGDSSTTVSPSPAIPERIQNGAGEVSGADPAVVQGVGEDKLPEGDAGRLGCEVIPVLARRVVALDHTGVTIRVLVGYTGQQTPYVRILDRETGNKLGDFAPGDIRLELAPGAYDLLIYAEVDDAGGFAQCDGGLRFTVPEPPVVRTPPTGDPDPCDDGEGSQSVNEAGDCEPDPEPTCEEMDPVTIAIGASSDSKYVYGSADISGGGDFKITLWAGTKHLPYIWKKAHDESSRECGEDPETLRVKFKHKGHIACKWTLVTDGPDGFKDIRVVRNTCR